MISGMFKTWDTDSDIQVSRLAVAMIYSIMKGNKPKASSLPYKTRDFQVPARDGSLLLARIYTPKKPSQRGCPAMFVCHAGDYIIGELETEEWLCATFASLGGIAVDVIYRHSPENVFPIPIYDSYDGLKWVCIASSRAKFGMTQKVNKVLSWLRTTSILE